MPLHPKDIACCERLIVSGKLQSPVPGINKEGSMPDFTNPSRAHEN